MADNEQRRTRAKVWGAEIDAARRRAGTADALAGGFIWIRHRLYFTADREPAWWAAVTLALATIVVAIMARRRVIGFPLALGFAASAAGFATGTVRTEIVAHPVLHYSASSVTLSGFVEIREERERSDRITVRVHHIESSRRLSEQPDRVRLAVRKNTAPAVGAASSS
jgi:competence protein ComEC